MHVPCAIAAGTASAAGCLGGPPVVRRAAYRYGGQIKAAALRHPVFANTAQRSASSAESPRGQSRSRGRSRCPPDRDLEDSDAALNGGMREGCCHLRTRRPRSQYGAADLSCLTRANCTALSAVRPSRNRLPAMLPRHSNIQTFPFLSIRQGLSHVVCARDARGHIARHRGFVPSAARVLVAIATSRRSLRAASMARRTLRSAGCLGIEQCAHASASSTSRISRPGVRPVLR